MSANKEQSDRCIELSKQYHKAGDAAQAMKFAKKAVKLDSSYDAAIKWESFLTSNPTIIPTTRKRSSPAAKKEEPEPSRPFTQDQVKGIKQILDKKNKGDLYGILGLEKDCSNSDIKKSYRKVTIYRSYGLIGKSRWNILNQRLHYYTIQTNAVLQEQMMLLKVCVPLKFSNIALMDSSR